MAWLPPPPPLFHAPAPRPPPPPAAQQLEGFQRDTWYVFERVLIVRDLATGGGRTFLSVNDAQDFRTELYAQYGACRSGNGCMHA